MECYDLISQWIHSRNWDLYRFSPPIVALVVQFSSRPFKKKLSAEHDQALQGFGITDSAQRERALLIAKDWDLQVSYFATAITTFFSIASITHAFSGGGTLFAIAVAILFLVSIWLYPNIFKSPLGSVSTPLASGAQKGFKGWLYRKRWSYADFYSRFLRGVNIILLILILITMPAKTN